MYLNSLSVYNRDGGTGGREGGDACCKSSCTTAEAVFFPADFCDFFSPETWFALFAVLAVASLVVPPS